jgi:Mg-chelatase subunit ChlD
VTLLTADRRRSLAASLAGLREVPRGGTPLYATTLAAARAMRASWDPKRVNAVVVLSDGKDTEGGVSLSALTAALRSFRDSARPVPIVTIGFGPDRDGRSLAAIADASGGAYYPADSAKDIRKVFLDALGQRTCRPDC